jgi:hypothetical protein
MFKFLAAILIIEGTLMFFVTTIIIIIILAALSAAPLLLAGHASAQSIPLPPPFPGSNDGGEEKKAPNDRDPPQIEILTTELHDGKNVFKVRIVDESSLQTREVKYVYDGQLRTDGLFRDQNNVYKALVDMHPPSRIVVVTAGDANGNIDSVYKEYKVSAPQDLFSQIIDMLSKISGHMQNLFGGG